MENSATAGSVLTKATKPIILIGVGLILLGALSIYAPQQSGMTVVPNIESIEFQLLRERWFALELPRHLTHFSPAAMERLAGMVGLTLRHTHYPRISYFAKSFVDPRLNGAWFSKTNDLFSRAFRLGLWLVEKTLFQLGNRPCFVAHLEQA